jgi:uncharacterized protein YjbI with pentapeptide repeats
MATEMELRGLDFLKARLENEYEACTFSVCSFTNVDLADVNFIDCSFESCDFTLAQVHETGFKDVRFSDCKMIGLVLTNCNHFLLKMRFEECQLDYTSFSGLKLNGILFKKCQIREADFTGADLSKAIFLECDLEGALFENSILEGTDFRSAYKFAFDPELNKIKGAQFTRMGLEGLLRKYDIDIS